MNSLTPPPTETDAFLHRELDHRQRDGRDIFLMWHTEANVLSLIVVDPRTYDSYQMIVPNDRGLDALEHPLFYVARAGLLNEKND